MITHFRPKIRSRHPSHDVLRAKLSFPLFPFKSVIRLGSFTKLESIVKDDEKVVEINTVNAIKNSADKLLMKQCFTNNNVKTADWWVYNNHNGNMPDSFNFKGKYDEVDYHYPEELPYPIIAKHRLGSKGRGNYKLDSVEALNTWLETRLDRLDEYIFEKFYNFVREYRLHVTENDYFYSCRKMLKSDTPDKDKWYRNDDHCVWIMEENKLFDKPTCWDEIVKHSITALKSTGLDFGAVDVKIQSENNSKGEQRKNIDFIIIEINSAPSFGEVTEEKYLEILPQLILNKNYKTKTNNNAKKKIESTC